MRRDWKIQTADKTPTTEVNTGPNLSKSLWSKETEDRQSHCDALDDFSEDCFSQDDFLDDLENLGSVDGGSRTSGLPKERNIEAADIWNGRSDEGSASDVIILNDMWDSNQAPERNLKAVERDKSHNLSRNPTDISRSKPRLWSGSSENETASLRQVPPTKFTKPSEELNNCNLDIRVNGWADLDAFQRGRQELFQNGRPLDLHEDYDDELPSLTNSPESRVKSSYKNFGDRADSGAWITTTSSDEELCQLVDATVPPANVEMCHQKPFLGTTAVNSHITIGQADRTLDGKNEKRTCKPTVHSSPVLGSPKPFAASRRVHTVTGETTQREGLPKSSHITHDPQCTFDLTGYDSNSYLSSDQESSHCLQHGIASPEVISIDDSNSGASDDHGAPHWKFHPSESPSPIMYAGKISQTVTPTRKVVTPAVAGSTCRDVCVSKSSELIDTHHGDDFRTSQVMNERSSTSARRFGHVRAWKKQSPSSAQVLNSREDIEHPKCTMSKLFVPKGRITGQEIQETGGLFDGIF